MKAQSQWSCEESAVPSDQLLTGTKKYCQSIGPNLIRDNRRVRQIRSPGFSADLWNEKHQVRMPMSNMIV